LILPGDRCLDPFAADEAVVPRHNVQTANVGNRGDMLKHAALMHLAQLLARREPRVPVNYLDTHAFLLHAPLANREWRQHVQGLAAARPAYGRYQALQQAGLADGDYLCSAGVVAVMLPEALLFLSECDPTTRALLRRQVDARGRVAVILNDAADWRVWRGPRPVGPLLALIDPFALTAADWSAAMAAVDGFAGRGEGGLLLVFDYGRRPVVTWPPPPPGWNGPVARLHAAPYLLCAYATPDLAGAAVETLVALGWQCS
jgi:23S rRNA A2030 N6-methylase RlmJ